MHCSEPPIIRLDNVEEIKEEIRSDRQKEKDWSWNEYKERKMYVFLCVSVHSSKYTSDRDIGPFFVPPRRG